METFAFGEFDPAKATGEQRLAYLVQTMRELSRQSDPQMMVQVYGSRIRRMLATDGSISLSRRELPAPKYRITRSTLWGPHVNPWKERDRLPVFDCGLLGELLYGDEPVVMEHLDIAADDPAIEHFDHYRSLMAVPLFDGGVAVNMVVLLSRTPGRFRREMLAEYVWMSNLFGRATQNLVLSGELKEAYDAVDRELSAVADIQRSLLPATLPTIRGLDLAAFYQTSRRAGGDYYDFFELPGGKWGMLIADVSGHGTPAAVLMAITHSIAHMHCDPPAPACRLLDAINSRLATHYTVDSGNFVTAFYGVYDPATRTLEHSNAGHPAPRLRHACGKVGAICTSGGLPLGIEPTERYTESSLRLEPGQTLVFYTDGITEARNSGDDLFGTERLDKAIARTAAPAESVLENILAAVECFSDGRSATDDRTLLAVNVLARGDS
jgi:sigma-B regulation protein RsbU (phosphoserine phosphatase)